MILKLLNGLMLLCLEINNLINGNIMKYIVWRNIEGKLIISCPLAKYLENETEEQYYERVKIKIREMNPELIDFEAVGYINQGEFDATYFDAYEWVENKLIINLNKLKQ